MLSFCWVASQRTPTGNTNGICHPTTCLLGLLCTSVGAASPGGQCLSRPASSSLGVQPSPPGVCLWRGWFPARLLSEQTTQLPGTRLGTVPHAPPLLPGVLPGEPHLFPCLGDMAALCTSRRLWPHVTCELGEVFISPKVTLSWAVSSGTAQREQVGQEHAWSLYNRQEKG